MNNFTEITTEEWDKSLETLTLGSIFLCSDWENKVSRTLPYVSYRHFRYNDTHLVRVAVVNKRNTIAPFSEGGDVVALSQTPLDLLKFQKDVLKQFGDSTRLRINERFAPVVESEGVLVTANEYVVDLDAELLPRVRKTLRHIISKPVSGEIRQQVDKSDIDVAYRLYVKHMRNVKNFAMPKELFSALINDHKANLWLWQFRSKVHAAAVFIPSDEEVLYSLSAANAEAFAAHAPHHLVYEALLSYQKQGKVRGSLGATGTGSPLEVFKRGWRGEVYQIFEIGMHTVLKKDSKLRQLVRFIPLPLYPLLTTKLGKHLF